MVIVVAVSAGSQHCRKAMTSGISQVIAERFRNGRIREADVATVRQNQATDINCIAFAMFAKFGVGNPITAAALV